MAGSVPPFRNERGLSLTGPTFRVGYISISLAYLLFISIFNPSSVYALIQEHIPKLIVYSDELDAQSFHGNRSHVDYFRLLQRDGDSLLIGARNFVYNISITDLTEHTSQRIEWISKQTDSDICFSKGKSESECHNYIRVLARKSQGEFLVCGTNAYKPMCRDYSIHADGTVSYKESSGVGRSPFDPRHNSTFVFADGDLYAGTVVDFQGMIPLIFREPLKTDHSDYKQLNVPDFVHSFEYGEYVFLFFREAAIEYMNCGKRIFSRVARVCKADQGVGQSRTTAASSWTSFLKSRLSCSVPGHYPFFFDEIQSVSDVILGVYGDSRNEVIYAIFTTPQNSIPGSAICSFSMRHILDAFQGSFLEQEDINSRWKPVPQRLVPEPRPGFCVNDSRTLPQETINFVRSHPLMEDVVSPFLGEPVLVKASFNYRFTKLTIDPQVHALNEESVDVIFIATDSGVILKAINTPSAEHDKRASPVVLEEIHVFESSVSINNLQIARPESANDDPKLIIITDNEVKAIELQRCHKASSCRTCVAMQDPYCAWSPNLGICGSVSKLGRDASLLQNVSFGVHRLCPRDGETNLIQWPASPLHATEPSSTPAPNLSSTGSCTPCVCTEQSTSTHNTIMSSPSTTPINNLPQKPTQAVTREGPYSSSPLKPGRGTLPIARDELPNYLPHSPELYETNIISGVPSGFRPIAQPPSRREHVPNSPPNIGIGYDAQGVTGPVIGASIGGPLIYSAETLAIAVTTACVAALVIGFISGFLFSRKCRADDFPHLSETPYMDSKLNKCENSADPNMYMANNVSLPAAPPKQINNLVNKYNPKNINVAGKAPTNCSINENNSNIKPAKCAYI